MWYDRRYDRTLCVYSFFYTFFFTFCTLFSGQTFIHFSHSIRFDLRLILNWVTFVNATRLPFHFILISNHLFLCNWMVYLDFYHVRQKLNAFCFLFCFFFSFFFSTWKLHSTTIKNHPEPSSGKELIFSSFTIFVLRSLHSMFWLFWYWLVLTLS